MKFPALISFLLIICCACSQKGVPVEQRKSDLTIFDVAAYMEAEIGRLQKSPPQIRKTLRLDGKREEKVLENVDIQEELAIFKEIDITKPSVAVHYTADTTRYQGAITSIRYHTEHPTRTVRSVQINYTAKQPTRIEIEKVSKSFLATNSQHLEYAPASGYRIESRQESWLTGAQKLLIVADFLAP